MAQVTQPFNYLSMVQNPAQEALQAFQGAYQARQQQQQNDAFRSAFNQFARKPDKGVSDYIQLLQVTPPEMVNTVKASFEAMTKEQRDVAQKDLSQLIFAFKYDAEQGKSMLDERIEAARNAGDMQEVQSLQTMRKLADIDSDSVVDALITQGGMAFGQDFLQNLGQRAGQTQSGKQYDNGTIVYITKDLGRIVRAPDGRIVEGEEAARVIKEANDYQLELAALKAGGTAQAKNLQARADAALDQMENVERSIDLYNQALDALNKGAQTGFLASFFPSIRAETREFERISDLLGLDILNAYTFGALSESELELALRVGGLDDIQDPEILKEQIIARRDAQEKLKRELRRAAIELSRPGMTIEKWLSNPKNFVSKQDAPTGGDDRFAGFSIVEE